MLVGCFRLVLLDRRFVASFGRTWTQDDYQHGPFVPLFSLFLLWYRRDMIIPFAGRGSWWGLPFLALWAVMRWAAVYFNFGSLPEYSMLPFFAGLALFVGGWQALRWAWPVDRLSDLHDSACRATSKGCSACSCRASPRG